MQMFASTMHLGKLYAKSNWFLSIAFLFTLFKENSDMTFKTSYSDALLMLLSGL